MDAVRVGSEDKNLKFHRGRCRCCLSFGYHRSLTQEYEEFGQKKILNEMLDACFRLQLVPESKAPEDYLICESCIFKLEDCDKFRRQIGEACKFFDRFTNDDDDVKGWTYFNSDTLDFRSYSPAASDSVKSEAGPNDDFVGDFSADDLIDDPDYGWEVVLGQIKEEKREKRKRKKKSKQLSCKGVRKKTTQKDTPIIVVPKLDKGKSYRRLPYKIEEGCLKCTQCGEQFYSKIRLSTHMNLHYPNHICDTCGKGFAVITRLKAHLKSHIRSSFPCDTCDKVYSSYNARESHRRYSHGKMTYRCPYCRIRFVNYHTRVKHMAEEHGEEARRHHCTICPSAFTRASHLSTHVKMVHLKEKRVTCETCGAAFFTKSMLDNHMAGHIAKRDHVCHICSRSYLRKKTLMYHMKAHKKDDKITEEKLPTSVVAVQGDKKDNRSLEDILPVSIVAVAM